MWDKISFENIEKYSYGIDTFQLAQAGLLFALTYTSDLPWWKWVLFICNYAGFEVRASRKVTTSNNPGANKQ